ncbi:hypothetical protein WMY93_005664 [Mugilogobius chulae]|uniref:Uncharacterized protein n=1 Tax=Mugilogobius chulae TaxID=88201 RepID=A0AAW0PRH8_9GOBI
MLIWSDPGIEPTTSLLGSQSSNHSATVHPGMVTMYFQIEVVYCSVMRRKLWNCLDSVTPDKSPSKQTAGDGEMLRPRTLDNTLMTSDQNFETGVQSQKPDSLC